MVIAGLGFYAQGGDIVSFGELSVLVEDQSFAVVVEDEDVTATLADDEVVVTIPGG